MAWKKRVLCPMAMAMAVFAAMGLEAVVPQKSSAQTRVVVFAAASTTNAVTDICRLYGKAGLGRAQPSFASSSTLAKQIASGAPADVFLSANPKWMNFLSEKKAIVVGTRFDLLGNRLVLIAPRDSPIGHLDVAPGLSLASLLGTDGRLAMGDPGHVPAGMYGKMAMTTLGIWKRLKNRLAPMKDVRAALVLVERAEVPLGLVYATDAAISQKVRAVGTFPATSHPAIVYPVAAVAHGNTTEARTFMDYLKSPQAQAIFKQYGFEVR